MNTIKIQEFSILEFVETFSSNCKYAFANNPMAFSRFNNPDALLNFNDCSPLYIKFQNTPILSNALEDSFNEQVEYQKKITKKAIKNIENEADNQPTACRLGFPEQEIEDCLNIREEYILKKKIKLEAYLKFLSDKEQTEEYYKNEYDNLGEAKNNKTKKIGIPNFEVEHIIYLFYQKDFESLDFGCDLYKIENILFNNTLNINNNNMEIIQKISVVPTGDNEPLYKIKEIYFKQDSENKDILHLEQQNSNYKLFLSKEDMLSYIDGLKKGLDSFSLNI